MTDVGACTEWTQYYTQVYPQAEQDYKAVMTEYKCWTVYLM